MVKVSIIKCENYEHDNVIKAIKNSLDLIGGLRKFVKTEDTVLLKVNASPDFLLRGRRQRIRQSSEPWQNL